MFQLLTYKNDGKTTFTYMLHNTETLEAVEVNIGPYPFGEIPNLSQDKLEALNANH